MKSVYSNIIDILNLVYSLNFDENAYTKEDKIKKEYYLKGIKDCINQIKQEELKVYREYPVEIVEEIIESFFTNIQDEDVQDEIAVAIWESIPDSIKERFENE